MLDQRNEAVHYPGKPETQMAILEIKKVMLELKLLKTGVENSTEGVADGNF